MTDIHLDSPEALEQALHVLRQVELNGSHKLTVTKIAQTRTARQQRAIEVYCRELAQALNDAEATFQDVIEKIAEAPWTQELVKEALFKRAGKQLFDKESTTQLERKEVSEVYERVNRLGAIFGVHVPWPTNEPDPTK